MVPEAKLRKARKIKPWQEATLHPKGLLEDAQTSDSYSFCSLRPTSPKPRESPGEQLSHPFSITYFNSWLEARLVARYSQCVLTESENCSASGITKQLLMGVIKSLGGDLYVL